jgi:hypothetical protein
MKTKIGKTTLTATIEGDNKIDFSVDGIEIEYTPEELIQLIKTDKDIISLLLDKFPKVIKEIKDVLDEKPAEKFEKLGAESKN